MDNEKRSIDEEPRALHYMNEQQHDDHSNTNDESSNSSINNMCDEDGSGGGGGGGHIDYVTYRHTPLCPIYYPLIYKQNFSKKNNNSDEDNDDEACCVTHHDDLGGDVAQQEIKNQSDHHDTQVVMNENIIRQRTEQEDHDSETERNDHHTTITNADNSNGNGEIKPMSIYAHTSVFVADKQKIIYSWGGRDNDSIQFQRYDITEKKWLSPTGNSELSDESPPTALYYHSMNYNPLNNSFYIIGGLRSDDSTIDNDLSIYSLDTGKWSYLLMSGDNENNPQPGIYGHVAVYRSFNNTIVLFGGYSDQLISDELFVFDCETEEWVERIIPSEPIESRSFSTAVYNEANDSMIIYAGELNTEEPLLTCELVIFYFKTNSWTVVKFEETKQCPVPQPIYGNTICLIDNRFLLSLGGCEHSNRIPKNDCFVFDVVRNEWSVCIQLGVAAGRLLCSSLVHDASGSGLYFYGGKTAEDVSTDSIIHVRYRFAGEFFFVEKILQKLKNCQLCDVRIITPSDD